MSQENTGRIAAGGQRSSIAPSTRKCLAISATTLFTKRAFVNVFTCGTRQQIARCVDSEFGGMAASTK